MMKKMNLILFLLFFFLTKILQLGCSSCYTFLILLELFALENIKIEMLNYSKNNFSCKMMIFVDLSANDRE